MEAELCEWGLWLRLGVDRVKLRLGEPCFFSLPFVILVLPLGSSGKDEADGPSVCHEDYE